MKDLLGRDKTNEQSSFVIVESRDHEIYFGRQVGKEDLTNEREALIVEQDEMDNYSG